LRSPGLIPRPLGRKNCAAGNGFAKLFSKASPIPRRLRRGWFIEDTTLPSVETIVKLIVALILILGVTGCQTSSLYSNLDEQEAVEMQAILLRQGIDCDKITGQENTWELKVSKNNLAEAVEILKGFGYPKDKFADMGQMFQKEGLVSSPLEERVRYIYALSQEVAQTVSKIDGVITARVHVVLPENDPLSEYFQPSSASVFVKHRQTFDIQSHIHQIKQLVINSIEGLSYDKVSVVPFASSLVFAKPKQFKRILGIEIVGGYAERFRILVFGLIFFLAISMLGCGYFFTKAYRKERSTSKELQRRDDYSEYVG
jgi:type III secretion protein J